MHAQAITAPPANDREWYSVRTLARHLDVKEDTLRSWVRRGIGPKHYKLGNLVRFRAEDVDEWITSARR